ncbi:hypothetical protein SmJEL517_g01571 [Synchytrium microbalum]|uniref:DNA polymerase epsilon subunit D n=1 Tax=Synchytrium microbalum TaxID=1806994 RepID=A0A507CE78_9FUNG|nr:uncharacterized protein SmJEL517_g01571 [Synchytrium microbalum]TPX36346.1 hypothetical protein SmJEL517_g01571 [Synchytrium microbalum]
MTGEATEAPTAKQLGIEDLEMPRTVISRTMKSAFPDGTSVDRASSSAVRRACTVFVSYLAATANDMTKNANKKTMTASEVFKALDLLEFKGFVGKVEEAFVEKRNAYRKRVAEQGGPLRTRGGSSGGSASKSRTRKGSDDDEDDEDVYEGEEGDDVDEMEDYGAGDDDDMMMDEGIPPAQPVFQPPPLPADPSGAPKRKLILKLGPNKAARSDDSSPSNSPAKQLE